MSRKKNLLDYLALTLFIMCMGLALNPGAAPAGR